MKTEQTCCPAAAKHQAEAQAKLDRANAAFFRKLGLKYIPAKKWYADQENA